MSGCGCGCTAQARQCTRETWWCKSTTEGDPSLERPCLACPAPVGGFSGSRSAGFIDMGGTVDVQPVGTVRGRVDCSGCASDADQMQMRMQVDQGMQQSRTSEGNVTGSVACQKGGSGVQRPE